MSTPAKQVIATATKEVGYREGRSGGHWNNDQKYSDQVPGLEWSDKQAWCATFVSWVAMKAGAAELFPRTASCDTAGSWFKARKRWSEYPAIGAQVFYGTPADLNHTGLVIAFDADTITTIEGNTNDTGSREGDGVYRKVRRRRDANVVGYGYPAYPEGIVSADPAWQKKTPTKPKPSTAAMPIHGADISHHQAGALDLAAAKKAGVGFLFHKATEGTGFVDGNYAKRRTAAARAGIPFGAYHFARPSAGDALAEARHFLATAKPKPGDLAPVLDLETNDARLSRGQLTSWVRTFVAEIKRQTGVLPIIYTPFALDQNFGCRLWAARYNNTNTPAVPPAPWKAWDIWQFSNGVYGRPNSVAGLGHVDLNTLRAGVTVADLVIPKPKRTTVDTHSDHPVVLQPAQLVRRAKPKKPTK